MNVEGADFKNRQELKMKMVKTQFKIGDDQPVTETTYTQASRAVTSMVRSNDAQSLQVVQNNKKTSIVLGMTQVERMPTEAQ